MDDVDTTNTEDTWCDGCKTLGGNWDCLGENEDSGDCNCVTCTGNEHCPECGR